MKSLLCIAVFATIGCEHYEIESVTIKKFRVDTVWQKPAVGVHDQISPMRSLARLSNGDTVPVSNSEQVGDSVEYRFVKLKKFEK